MHYNGFIKPGVMQYTVSIKNQVINHKTYCYENFHLYVAAPALL